jgi:hypothetical protein
MLIVSCSSKTHRCLALLPLSATLRLGEKFPDLAGIERTGEAERPAERTSALCQIETPQVGMHVRTPARRPSTRIGDQNTLDRHDS